MKNLFSSLSIAPMQRFVFQIDTFKTKENKQQVLDKTRKDLDNMQKRVEIMRSNTAETYMIKNDIVIGPGNNASFPKEGAREISSKLHSAKFIDVYVLYDRLLIFYKTPLPQKPIAYQTSIIWYDAVKDEVVYMTKRATESSVTVDGKSKIYKDHLFDLVKDQD